MKDKPIQLASDGDRAVLREYLTKRLKQLKRELKRANGKLEASYIEGAAMEIEFAFDELLAEEPPDLRKKPVAQ